MIHFPTVETWCTWFFVRGFTVLLLVRCFKNRVDFLRDFLTLSSSRAACMALSKVGGFLAFIKSLRFSSPSMNTWIVCAFKLFSKAIAASNVFPLVSCSRMSVCNDSIREEYDATSSFGLCLLKYSSRYKCVVVRLGSSEFFNVSLNKTFYSYTGPSQG